MQEFVEVTSILRDACKDLKRGQMVHVPELTLMDAMASIQILDPRMDGGMRPMPNNLISPCDRIDADTPNSPFDVNAPLSLHDLLWIMDRVSACEAAWLQSDSLSGAALSQTIHTCLWIHRLASLHPAGPMDSPGAPSSLACHVLRPFLIGVLKTVGLVWDELSKGNLIDGEDYHGDKAGISLLEDLDPFQAIAELQTAIAWTSETSQVSGAALGHAVCQRLSFRRFFLLSVLHIARLDPTLPSFVRSNDVQSTLREVQENVELASAALQAIFALSTPANTPDLQSAPSAIARSSFDPGYARNAVATDLNYAPYSMPPASPLQLPQPNAWRETYEQILEGMIGFDWLVESSRGWTDWKTFFDHAATTFQSKPVQPYVRSLRQSAVCSDATIALQMPLAFIAESFFRETVALDVPRLSHTLSTNNPTSPLLKRIDWFVERVSGQLVSHLRNLAQNRSRSKRRLAHSYADLLALSDEASALGADLANEVDVHPDVLQTSIQTLLLDVMLHCIMSGIELQLYRDDELNVVYWMASRVADEAFDVWHSLAEWLQSKPTSDDPIRCTAALLCAEHQMRHHDVVRKACTAFCLLYSRLQHDRSRLDWLLPHGDVDAASTRLPDETAFVIFCKRFKWLVVAHKPQSQLELKEIWRSYCKSQSQRSHNTDESSRLNAAGELLDQAAELCRAINHDDAKRVLPPFATTTANLSQPFARTSKMCKDSARHHPKEKSTPPACLLPLTFTQGTNAHPWFPEVV